MQARMQETAMHSIPDIDSFAAAFNGMDMDIDHLPDMQDLPDVDDDIGNLDIDDYGGYDA